MTDNLYDALEVCLQALEQGADPESCLALFPALAEELRPILQTAMQARAQAVRDVPADAMRRGRARVLQHAAELREGQQIGAVPFWRRSGHASRAFRWAITSLATLVFLLSGGTGLVFASSNSLPGDNLYPVKRSWEGVQLVLIIDPTARSQRETEFEQERVQEIHALYSQSRKTQVDFQGKVETQQANVWQIAGLQIAVDPETAFSGQIVPGSFVRVTGETENGIIQAQRIDLIVPVSVTPAPAPTRQLLPSRIPSIERTPEATEQHDGSGSGDTPQVKGTQQPDQTETSGEKNPGKTPKPGDGGGGDGGSGAGDGGGDGGGGF
jgi:uncharacterized membrane protein YgcG